MWMDVVCRAQRLLALRNFLKELPCADLSPLPVGSVVVDESLVKLIEEEVIQNNVSAADMLNDRVDFVV